MPHGGPKMAAWQSKHRRRLLIALMTVTKRTSPRKGGIWQTPFFVVKYGSIIHMSELEAMVFVSAKTSIPVPKIYCAFEQRGRVYIMMERVRGEILFNAWPKMPESTKNDIRNQLTDHLNELRSLSPPVPGQVGSAEYNELHDFRVSGDHSMGPFDIAGYHQYLGTDYALEKALEKEEDSAERRLAEDMSKRTWQTRFTHGDLSSFNIIVNKGKVTAILDWEMAGWMPEYWEYTSSWKVNLYDQWWRPDLGKILQHYSQELQMDNMRRALFPPT